MEKRIDIYNLEHLAELAREKTVKFQGDVWLSHMRDGEYLCKDEYQGKNIVTTQGLNSLLDTAVGAVTQITAWYCGIFKTNYVPLAGSIASTALGAAGLFGECQDADYSTPATNRAAYPIVAASGGVITNAASPAVFTIAAASITVYGSFLASSAAKTATTGVLLAAKKFDTSRAVVTSDQLTITYQISSSSS